MKCSGRRPVGGRNTNTHTQLHTYSHSGENNRTKMSLSTSEAQSYHSPPRWSITPAHVHSLTLFTLIQVEALTCVTCSLHHAVFFFFLRSAKLSLHHVTEGGAPHQRGMTLYLSPQVPTFLWWQSVWNLPEDPGWKTGIPTPSGFPCQVSSANTPAPASENTQLMN